jgi:hypothetical protein
MPDLESREDQRHERSATRYGILQCGTLNLLIILVNN